MAKEYYVYVLRSQKNGRLYTGSTENVERRLAEHNAGRSSSTRHITPLILVRKEIFLSRAEAVKRERYLKSGLGRQELKRLLFEK